MRIRIISPLSIASLFIIIAAWIDIAECFITQLVSFYFLTSIISLSLLITFIFLFFFIVFSDHCLSFCTFSFGHFVVCPS